MDTILASTFALLFRALVAQPFTIPSASMAPTVEVGDYVWSSKFSYGYSNFSLPMGDILPAFTFAKTGPQRGDVVIFRLPSDPSIDYIKRVVGLPGDTVQIRDGITYLNGTALKREPAGSYDGPAGPFAEDIEARTFTETLPDGRRYVIIEMTEQTMGDNTAVFDVPPGHYFVMGDNRDNASDSRFGVGFVPEANIIAKALVAVTWPGGKFTLRDVK